MDELFEALVFLGVLSTASVSSKKEGVFFISVHHLFNLGDVISHQTCDPAMT